ncbi:hypothetical protein GCM10011512_15120 [Tersicoccus solisilvae]|uniref:Four-helix bundle copper-binding protein n=1 Tax=Tersicoccus solisilvae TaxID=1882339 RepID=A0ABQ1P1M9_9MICC|nr:four-helix bundle copper-binding protein [Tersicoccus solisilvae]GGC89173.1 hypothetical protein GCM10011512_15120 [Tersicoccus solisilvae]
MSDIHRALLLHPAAPDVPPGDRSVEGRMIDACAATAAICRVAADASLESAVTDDVRERMRAEQSCADVCLATAAVLSRPGTLISASGRDLLVTLVDACRHACEVTRRLCSECAGTHEHCRLAAESCAHCAQACRDLLRHLQESR